MKVTIQIPAEMQTKFELNRAYILQVGGLTERDYNAFWHELGCQFLEELYPRDELNVLYKLHASSVQFWNWFKAEYKKYEHELIPCIQVENMKPTLKLLTDELNQMVHDSYVEVSYQHNYLKFCELP